MFDVLDFLAVSRRLLQLLYDQRSRRGQNVNCGLSVLDRELDCNFDTFPGLSGFGNVISDFLWGLEKKNDGQYEIEQLRKNLNFYNGCEILRLVSPLKKVSIAGQFKKTDGL